MDDLVKEFIEETVESLSELDMDLVKLEQDPENEELLAKIFRLMHTIKGTCGFLGLPRLENTAHAAENLLDLFRSGEMDITESAMTVLFLSIDRVRYIVTEIENTGAEPSGDDKDVIEQIENEIIKGTSDEVEATAPVEDIPAEETIDDNADFIDPFEEENKAIEAQLAAAEAAETAQEEPEPKLEEAKPAEKTPTESPKPSKPASEKSPEFLKVQMSVLEDLINMVSELVLTRNQLLQLIELDEDSAASTPLQRLNRIASDLQEGVMKTRMQPIGNAWSKLPRIVRDLTNELDKKVTLDMSGEETELDRQVLEMIKDPLTHMVRNSCDHGVEMPSERKAAGKPESGTIELKAYHEGGFIIIEINDDGKGLDAKVIGKKAAEKGLITADQLENLSDKQLLQNIFKPGFSMAEKVTSVSGRGVGMDVVRTNIEKIGGTIDMESTLGKGTKFTIQIPLTLAIISALIVEIDSLRYAIPQLNIQELVRTHSSDEDKIEKINDRPVFRLRDRIIPLIDSQTLFEGFIANDFTADALEKLAESQSEDIDITDKLIVVISAGSSYFGLVVDAIHDMEEIVIKSISTVLHNTKIFAGNTILGDGEVIMILDPAGIARRFEVSNDLNTTDEYKSEIGKNINMRISEKASMLVFKAGASTPKAIPVALISRLQRFKREEVTDSGDQLIVKYNDHLMPLYYAEDGMKLPDGEEITTLILSDDVSDAVMGIVIEEVVDIVEDHLDLSTSTARAGIIGSVRLDDQTVDVIDIAYYLGHTKEDFFSTQIHAQTPFVDAAAHAASKNSEYKSDQPRVLVVDDSPFFRNMLKPILTSSGYDVTTSEDPIEAMKLHDRGVMFDIILSDIEMPNMTGYEFVEEMKKESDWKDLPFIAITSHTTTQDVEYGYEKGFSKYIGKFDKDELFKTMNTVLSNRA